MRPYVRRDIDEASSAIERLAEIMPKLTQEEFIDFAARAKGLGKAAENLRDECERHIKKDLLNGAEGKIIGEQFMAQVEFTNSLAFNQAAFSKAEPDLFAQYKTERTSTRLTFDVR